MAELDLLAWVGGVSLICCGIRFGVRVDDPRLLELLPDYLPPGSQPTEGGLQYLYSLRAEDGVFRLYVGPYPACEYADPEETLDGLRSRLELRIAFYTPDRLFVHAGVVEWGGRAILLPGRSGCGKTTLVAELVRAGAGYYSDEFAVLDEQGLVHPWARPLRVRAPGSDKTRLCHAAELDGKAGDRPLPVGLIVAARHREAAVWKPRPLARSEAMLALLENTVVARERPEMALPVLRRAVAEADAVEGVRGEARAAVQALMEAAGACKPFVP